MDINAMGTGVPQIGLPKQQDAPPPQEGTQEPVDKVEKGEEGFAHKVFRGVGKLVGGAIGILPGASYGAVKGAATEDPHSLVGVKETKILRAVGAGAGLVLGGIIALTGGPIAIVAGLVGGPIVGSAIAQGLPAAVDGGFAAAKGAAKGAWSGMKKGAEMGGKFVDWVASKIPEKPDAPPPAEGPKPPTPEQPPQAPA